MSRAETFAISWDMFLDRHVRIAEANELYDLAFFCKHSRLLWSAGRAFWAIIAREFFTSIFHNYSV